MNGQNPEKERFHIPGTQIFMFADLVEHSTCDAKNKYCKLSSVLFIANVTAKLK
jgi:hypothetical protein